jgi:hypothetical protein
MAGLPEKAAATQSSRKPSPVVSGSPYHYSSCYRSSGRSRMFKLRLGWNRGFEPIRESPSSVPLSHVWVSIAVLFFFVLCFLFRIFVVVFVSSPASASICSLSLLSLLPLDVSVYLSICPVRLPSNVSAKKKRQVES